MTTIPAVDLRVLDRRALDVTGEVTAQVTAADLDRPTPCAAWNLGDSALATASRWSDTSKTRGPGAAFGIRVPVPGHAPDFERLLGRSPSWEAPC
ncbi:hypothetical protein GCM10012278_07970 [Nonomuraea glycinis]|uniref:Uncharacterized protein n=1 Tax=Nonomuraea glycinis TaxID=2047744 RepID=A0A918E3U1_9ACTN|nr:hypothetical protein GCM10012278_07970 [Nonomuraea glycinis]